MILKPADDKTKDLQALDALLRHPDATAEIRQKIEREIRNIRSGLKGEAETAYELDFNFRSDNWIVIHDLRIEHGGRVAQIDHLLMNRFMRIYVCESKRFQEGVAINNHGEFSAFFNHKPYGIPSPIEQNKRHILVLKSLFDDGVVELPTRLGLKLRPVIESLVLVSKGARISRPKVALPGLETIVKSDQLVAHIEKQGDKEGPLAMAKLVSQETLHELAAKLIALHRPIAFDWAAKFGLSTPGLETQSCAQSAPAEPAEPEKVEEAGATHQANSKLVCASCEVVVPYVVAKFCWTNKRFAGKVYCRACQTAV